MATKNIGEVLKAYRKTKGITQLELAKLLGITRPYVVMIEKGTYIPGIKLTRAIADLTKTPIKDLI